uniref:Uncharacterized protein n=1 Tax=Avena sativa TaxID=4498 RepID=A0ACD5YWA1_AVESA
MVSVSSPPSSQTARATESTCTTEKVEGLHRCEIRNYSLIKDLATGNSPVRSGAFTVGGYDWCLLFYPSGGRRVPKGDSAVYLQLMTSGATTRATFLVRIINPASGQSRLHGHAGIGLYSNDETSTDAMNGIRLMRTTELERTYVDRDRDRFIIECSLSVIGEPRASATTPLGVPVPPPPSDLPAHRLVLAMRSPVFKASLFGPMSEGKDGSCNITIEGVDPAVFKALLDVIYSDSFPTMDNLSEDANRELARHLLAAADRYGMDRLKAQCESILSKSLSAEGKGSVASRKDDQLSCFTFLSCFSKAVGSIFKIHQVQSAVSSLSANYFF